MGPVGLFKKMKNEAGIPSPELMRRGMLASGWIVDLEKTDLWVGHGIQPDRELRAPVARDPDGCPKSLWNASCVCKITVGILRADQDPYQATCRQQVPRKLLGELRPGHTWVAVRVNPNDPQEVAIDFQAAPPTAT